ncbi:putative toxin-antitoxin system toxin component, PIN family [Candidatus Pacearchaeota archaeon CG10_big_fil_rev_8_21_14_0_10_31_24]|nr:MAG: putative toxin-antitoxin system toxin component, PIN family [Candidatus Pacearchaeota archaeon CG10_big_fil_rev_8_21_14_0_10_31_24]
MKITLDTNFLISSTQWKNSVAHKILIKLIRNNYELFTTEEILTEFSEVLARDFEYENNEIEKILTNVLGFVKIIKPNIKIEVVKEDPDDDKIIECAISSSSDYIITYDKHLLNLKEYEEIKIITPEEAMKTFA